MKRWKQLLQNKTAILLISVVILAAAVAAVFLSVGRQKDETAETVGESDSRQEELSESAEKKNESSEVPDNPVYKDATKTVEERVEDLLSYMTLEEKIAQMAQPERNAASGGISVEETAKYAVGSIFSGGGSLPEAGNTAADWLKMINVYQEAAMSSRLGIPLLYGVDAVHGHNNVYGSVIFPHNIGLGAAGDAELALRIGTAVAAEVRATGVNWDFAPTLGVVHNERWGRTYECFSERPEDVTELGAAYVKGLQGIAGTDPFLDTEHVIATAKHFIGEGLTTDGVNQGDVELTEEEFEKYLEAELLPPYRAAIEAGARTVMVSFNSINSVKCHGNKELLTGLLRGKLGFNGVIVSDYNGVQQVDTPNGTYEEQVAQCVNAGIDVFMEPFDWKKFMTVLKSSVEKGTVSEETIDEAVKRILTLKFEAGLFENPYIEEEKAEAVGSEAHREIAREAVRKSMVLLKNNKLSDGRTMLEQLPDYDNILVAGKAADDIGTQCGGWTISWQGSKGDITQGTTVLEGIRKAAGEEKITYSARGLVQDGAQAAVVVLAEPPYAETDGDRLPEELTLEESEWNVLRFIREQEPELPVLVILLSGRPVTVADELEQMDALVAAWLPGTEGDGISDVLFGDYDFTGKLTYTWPWYAEDIKNKFTEPASVLFPYGSGLTKSETVSLPEKPEQTVSQAFAENTIKLSKTGGVVEAEDFYEAQKCQTEETSDDGGGENIGYTEAGTTLSYYVEFPEDGYYEVIYRAAVDGGNDIDAAAELYVDGQKVSQASFAATGGWQNWEDHSSFAGIRSGTHQVTFQALAGGFNLNKITFRKAGDYQSTIAEETQNGEDTAMPTIKAAVQRKAAVDVYLTSTEKSQDKDWYNAPKTIQNTISSQPPLSVTDEEDAGITTIRLDPKTTYQTFLGIGTSLEESSVQNLTALKPELRRDFIRNLIDPKNGSGMTLFRLTIGTSDFTSRRFYTYYDEAPAGEPDWENGFSIQKDIDYGIIDTIKMVLEEAEKLGIRDEIKFFASPWTPPGWMKKETSASRSYPDNELLLKGGTLSTAYIEDLAMYYTRYLEEYKKLGIDIYAMTLQNEPELEINYPSCKISGNQEGHLAAALKKNIAKSSILSKSAPVKLWVYDHNASGVEKYLKELLAVEGANEAIDGVAFHDYDGELSLMQKVLDQYLTGDQTVSLTERSVWGAAGADRIIQYLRNGSTSYNSWVTMLDSTISKHQWVGTPDPTMFVRDKGSDFDYWATPEYYIIGQFGRFVRPGYVRIESDYGSAATVTTVAFQDPETGSITVIAVNQTAKPQPFRIIWENSQVTSEIPAQNIATYIISQ